MQDTPEKENYEIIDVKRQSNDQSRQEMPSRKINNSAFTCPYNNINISDFEEKNYKQTYQKRQYIPTSVRNLISPSQKQKGNGPIQKGIGIIKLVKIILFLYVIFFTVMFIIGIFLPGEYHYSSQEEHSSLETFLVFILVLFLLGFCIVSYILHQMVISKVISKVSKNMPSAQDVIYKCFAKPTLPDIKKKFFNALKIAYYRIDEVRAQVDMMTQIMTKINPSYKKYVKTDDFISFNYDNLPLDLVEFRSVGREANSCIFIRTRIDKPISCETYIKTKETTSNSFSFADNFLVQSSNPQEARSLLTTSFRNGLIKYRKGHNNCSIDILFSNKISDRENIFICITSQKNFFEMPEADWQDPNKSYRIVDEIRELLFVVDALKLDQDMGM